MLTVLGFLSGCIRLSRLYMVYEGLAEDMLVGTWPCDSSDVGPRAGAYMITTPWYPSLG